MHRPWPGAPSAHRQSASWPGFTMTAPDQPPTGDPWSSVPTRGPAPILPAVANAAAGSALPAAKTRCRVS